MERCFHAWAHCFVSEAADREAKLRRAVGFMRARAYTMCMRAWVDLYVEAREAKAR